MAWVFFGGSPSRKPLSWSEEGKDCGYRRKHQKHLGLPKARFWKDPTWSPPQISDDLRMVTWEYVWENPWDSSLFLFWAHRQRGLFIECFPKIKGNGHRTWPLPPFMSAHFPIRNQNIEKSSLNTLSGSWLIVLYHDSGQDIILHQACLPSKARNSLSVNFQPSIRLSWTRITKTNRRLFSGNHEIHGNPGYCRELCQDLQQKATFVQSAPTEQQQQDQASHNGKSMQNQQIPWHKLRHQWVLLLLQWRCLRKKLPRSMAPALWPCKSPL